MCDRGVDGYNSHSRIDFWVNCIFCDRGVDGYNSHSRIDFWVNYILCVTEVLMVTVIIRGLRVCDRGVDCDSFHSRIDFGLIIFCVWQSVDGDSFHSWIDFGLIIFSVWQTRCWTCISSFQRFWVSYTLCVIRGLCASDIITSSYPATLCSLGLRFVCDRDVGDT